MNRTLLIASVFSASVYCNAQIFPLPKITPLVPTNGTITLAWEFGVPTRNTLSNVTSGVAVAAGYFNYYMVSGLTIGSTNTFVVFNEAGLSNMATGVAAPFVDSSTLRIHSFMVTVPSKTNGITRVLTSTNLSIWTDVTSLTNTGPKYQFIWTNDGGTRFFRSISP